MTTDILSPQHVLERRGGLSIVGDFASLRLRLLFGDVWRRLPQRDIGRVYAALGSPKESHVLLVVDHGGGDLAHSLSGQASRMAGHIRIFVNGWYLDCCSAAWARYVIAHEVGHVAAGHLGPACQDIEPGLVPPLVMLAHTPNDISPNPPAGTAAYERWQHEEADADALAARWGFPKPASDSYHQKRQAVQRPVVMRYDLVTNQWTEHARR